MTAAMPSVITQCLAAAVCTCNRNGDLAQYQKGVVESYEKIEKAPGPIGSNRWSPHQPADGASPGDASFRLYHQKSTGS